MLFMYIHTQPLEKCLADKPEEVKKRAAKAEEEAKKAGIKRVGSYVAAHEHTMYIVFDAPDTAELEKFLLPMTLWGTAKLVPVMTLEQTAAMAQ